MAEKKKRSPRKGSEGRSPKHKAGKRQPRDALTPEQEAFCRQYALNGGNGAEAVRAAFPARQWGHQVAAEKASKLIALTKIATRVAELTEIAKRIADEQFSVRAEDVIYRLKLIGFASLKDYLQLDDDGNPTVSFKHTTEEQFFALNEVTVEEIETGKRTGKRVKVKLPNRIDALVRLGQHIGLFKEKVEHTHEIKIVEEAARDLDRRLAELAARTGASGDPGHLH